MLTLSELKCDFQEQEIFSCLSLSILESSIYRIQGPNGCGKTSFFKIIANIIKPSHGNILWNNSQEKFILYFDELVSYLGHQLAMMPEYTVLQNLLFWANLRNTELLIDPAIAHFKLTEFMDIKCKELSAGWIKRVALARLIISNTKIWLLDEPETNLDKEGCELLLKLLQVKVNSGGIALIASHNHDLYSKIPIINLNDFKYDK